MTESHKTQQSYEYAKGAYSYYKKYGLLALVNLWWEWLIIKPERLTAISTLCIFVATAVAAAVGYAQWSILGEQIKDNRAQIAAYLTISNATNSFIRIGPDGTVSGSVAISNTGGSSAREVYIQFQGGLFKRTIKLFNDMIAGPFEIDNKTPLIQTFDGVPKLEKGALIFVQAENSVIVLNFRLDYQTVFKQAASQNMTLIAYCCGSKDQLNQDVSLVRPFNPSRVGMDDAEPTEKK